VIQVMLNVPGVSHIFVCINKRHEIVKMFITVICVATCYIYCHVLKLMGNWHFSGLGICNKGAQRLLHHAKSFRCVATVQTASNCGCCLDCLEYARGVSSNIISTVFLDCASFKMDGEGCNVNFTTDKHNSWYTFNTYQCSRT